MQDRDLQGLHLQGWFYAAVSSSRTGAFCFKRRTNSRIHAGWSGQARAETIVPSTTASVLRNSAPAALMSGAANRRHDEMLAHSPRKGILARRQCPDCRRSIQETSGGVPSTFFRDRESATEGFGWHRLPHRRQVSVQDAISNVTRARAQRPRPRTHARNARSHEPTGCRCLL